MKHDANASSNVAAEQVQFFFIMHFVIILHVRSQENVLLYLFRNTFDNTWVNVYWNWSAWLGKCFIASIKADNGWIKTKEY